MNFNGGFYMALKIFWAGDSTVKQNDYTSYPQTGIGQGFLLFMKKNIQMVNKAENGRSTKSFIAEGILDAIDNEIGKDDFLFIQFGHNDEKPDEKRYTKPYGSYQENLKLFIEVARKHSAHPVLITPLYRRLFDENENLIDNTHLDYPDAMKALGEEMNVPVIDLCTISKSFIQKLGDEKSKPLFMHLEKDAYKNYPDGKIDNTHLQYAGAVAFAELIANELRKLGGIYEDLLIPLNLEKENPNLLKD